MKAREKIKYATEFLEKTIPYSISHIQIDYEDPRIKLVLNDGIKIYIQYNDHDQYSYSILFSNGYLDRCRFDNYDDTWDVISKPHHFHPKLSKVAIDSPMSGDFHHDLDLLIQAIISGKFYKNN